MKTTKKIVAADHRPGPIVSRADLLWFVDSVSRYSGDLSRGLGELSRISGDLSRHAGAVSRYFGDVSRVLNGDAGALAQP